MCDWINKLYEGIFNLFLFVIIKRKIICENNTTLHKANNIFEI